MKKTLFLASAVVLGLTACGDKSGKQQPETVPVQAQGQETVQAVVSGGIAYVDLDALLSQYNLYIDKNAELEEKAKKAESELTSKGRSLEKSFADAQDKIEKGLVTRSEAMQLQEDLQRQEQSFYEHRERVQLELGEASQVLLNNIVENVDKFLKEFNSDYRYSMILTTSNGAPVLHADPRLNITGTVVAGLNESYEAEKKSKPKK